MCLYKCILYQNRHNTNVMYFLLVLGICFYKINQSHGNATNIGIRPENLSVNDITDALLTILEIHEDGNATNSKRIMELKDKLQRIDSYVIDKEKYRELLVNETRHSNLNQTNFYAALKEQDYFQTLTNDTKNLYLKLKVKMNRDDIVKILSERGDNKNIIRSARRSMMENYVPKKMSERKFEESIDRFLGEIASDDHKFDENDRYIKNWGTYAVEYIGFTIKHFGHLTINVTDSFHSMQNQGERFKKGERSDLKKCF